MRRSRFLLVMVSMSLGFMVSCGGSNSVTGSTLTHKPSTAALNISMRDMPMQGISVLAFRVTVTGAALQPGNISLINSPMTLEMTQLQSMPAYLNTVSVPEGNYTGITFTFANPRLTFLNNTGSGGMMGGISCPTGQICQVTPPTLSGSTTITGSPFPFDAQAGNPLGLMMDFDLMDSFQGSNFWGMGFSPMMSGFFQQAGTNVGNFGGMFDEMPGMIGQVTSVDAADNSFTMRFMQFAPSLTFTVDGKTTYQGFDAIGKPNNLSGLAAGQIVEVDAELLGSGTLYASEVNLESQSGNEIEGLVTGIDSANGWCDVVVMNEAPDFSGVNVGDVMRMGWQTGTTFGMDFEDMPMGGWGFSGVSDLMPGQVVLFQTNSGATTGTPPEVGVTGMRLMGSWVTGTISQMLNSTDFMLTPTNGIFPAVGMNNLHITTSAQTRFDGVSGMSGLSAGSTVSLRGPMFANSGNPTVVASYVLKR